jgi:hypothetical protein
MVDSMRRDELVMEITTPCELRGFPVSRASCDVCWTHPSTRVVAGSSQPGSKKRNLDHLYGINVREDFADKLGKLQKKTDSQSQDHKYRVGIIE